VKKKPEHDEVITIDCHYVRELLTASYLIKRDGNGIIVETGHGASAEHIFNSIRENGLAPEDISHIFITHIHLDHCGGLSALLKKCVNATVICHPRARPHLIDPSRLIQGSIMVYGEPLYKSLYGTVEPIAAEKIQTAEDNEIIIIGKSSYTILHTEGHAKHHICIHDLTNNTIFTGDTFGLAYPDFQRGSKKFIYPATTPTDFNIPEARKSIERIQGLKAEALWLTHFGQWEDIGYGADSLLEALDKIEKFQTEALKKNLEGKDLEIFCYEKFKAFINSGLENRNLVLSAGQWKVFDYDMRINSMGIARSIDKQRERI